MIGTPSSEDQQLNIIAQEVSSIQHQSLIAIATEYTFPDMPAVLGNVTVAVAVVNNPRVNRCNMHSLLIVIYLSSDGHSLTISSS